MILHSEIDSSNNELCVTPLGGLGNRLLVLSAAIRFINKGYYSKLKVNWTRSYEIDVEMDDILTIDCPIIRGIPSPESKYLPLQTLPDIGVPTVPQLSLTHYSTFRSIHDLPSTDLIPEWKTAIQKIKYSSLLRSIASTIDVSDRIGIHCRRTDFWSNNHENAARTYVRLDKDFILYLKERHNTEKFFIATDSPYTLVAFEEAFKGQIIHYPKANYPMWRTRSADCVHDSIIDHILLSRCKRIIADSGSSFSQTAAWLGNKDKERPSFK